MFVLLDRDGVINTYQKDAYLSSAADVAFVPGTLEAVRRLTQAGVEIVIISNQAGVGKGLLAEETLKEITAEIVARLEAAGGKIRDIIYCLHAPDKGCDCRKPAPGMILDAARRHGFNLAETYFIGDSGTDMEAAKAAGCRSILVRSGQAPRGPIDSDYVVDNLLDAVRWILLRPGIYEGDIGGYVHALGDMRRQIESLSGRVLIAHHGDCDGITGGGLLAAFLRNRGVDVRFASAPEFRLKDLPYFEEAFAGCDTGIFVEAQGMPPEYARLDAHFLNIDHHPHPEDTPIRRMLNPRRHGITPNPAIGLVMHELLGDALPDTASWLPALASIVDYCPLAARVMIEKNSRELERLDDLRDTFLASQYVLPYTTDLADFLSTLPTPDELIAREPFCSRRTLFREKISNAVDTARVGKSLVIADTKLGDMRIASPLANRLGDIYSTKCVVVLEHSPDNVRLSVRCRKQEIHIGRVLGMIVQRIGAGDGTGHEKAGSARIPRDKVQDFLWQLEEEIG